MGDNLEECFQHLHKPRVDKRAPLKCYQQIKFSEESAPGQIQATLDHFYTLERLFGKKVVLLDIKIDAYRDGRLFVPFKLQEMMAEVGRRVAMIPVELEGSGDGSGGGGYYGLLYDKTRQSLELFRLPGSRLYPELYPIEKKLVNLFEQKFKMPVLQFYQAVRAEPAEGTRDYETWPAYLAYKRLQKGGMDREIVANYAMEDLVRGSKEYKQFLDAFYR